MSELTTYQKAALNYKNHIALTANAGSGKTFLFAKRFVNIAEFENPTLDRIIAITFTDKAASELYVKISREIQERILNSESPEERFKFKEMRKHLVSANISTIHSFCTEILREYAPQANIDTNFTTVDETISGELISQSFETIYENEIAFGNENLKVLLRYFQNKTTLKQAIVNAIKKRRTIGKIKQEFYSKSDTKSIILEKFEKYFNDIFSSKIDEIVHLLNEVSAEFLSEKPKNNNAQKMNSWLNNFPTNGELFEKLKYLLMSDFYSSFLTLKKDVSSEVAKTLTNPEEKSKKITEFYSAVSNLKISKKDENLDSLILLNSSFLSFFDKILSVYTEKKRENSFLDFEDLILNSEFVISQKEIQAELSEKFKFIMIDEFQDTNESQVEIFLPILEYLKKGNLFVVGDEKQSIYMFNNAELEIFADTKTNVSANFGQVLELPHSFRLAPNLAFFTNILFAEIFKNPKPIFNEVEYNKMVSTRPKSEKGKLEFLLIENDSELSEAEIIARKIKSIVLNENAKFDEFGILVYKNSFVGELERVFQLSKIPYSIIGGQGFYQETVITDIKNYFSFLLSPEDDFSLVAILRSPFFLFEDRLILEIFAQSGNSFWQKLMDFHTESEIVVNTKKILKKHVEMADFLEPLSLIKIVLEDSGFWGLVSASKNGNQNIANLKKFISISLSKIGNEISTLFDFIEFLDHSIKKVEESNAELFESENKVQILTIHKAKGLDFKRVFLYKMNAKLNKNSANSNEIFIDKTFGLMAKSPSANYFDEYLTSSIYWIYKYYDKQKHEAEFKRLLYVAITRAKDELYISAKLNKPNKDNIVKNDGFFKMILEGLGISETDLPFAKNGNLDFINLEKNEIYQDSIEMVINKSEIIDEVITDEEKSEEVVRKENLTFPLKDFEKNEVISASKISYFLQCPRKYELTYELGLGKLQGLLNSKVEFEYSSEQNEDEQIPSNLIGTILHKIMELNVLNIEQKSEIEEVIGQFTNDLNLGKSIFEEILPILNNFFNSKEYSVIQNGQEFWNEKEIYIKENDYFLYGIIDKIIRYKEKILIIDYKSDRNIEQKYLQKFEQYLPQLKFYSYLIYKLFENVNSVEAQLLFFRKPELSQKKIFTKTEILEFGKEIAEIVHKIRNKNYDANYNFCPNCPFFSNNKCIVD